jgi:hypothetical protein
MCIQGVSLLNLGKDMSYSKQGSFPFSSVILVNVMTVFETSHVHLLPDPTYFSFMIIFPYPSLLYKQYSWKQHYCGT